MNWITWYGQAGGRTTRSHAVRGILDNRTLCGRTVPTLHNVAYNKTNKCSLCLRAMEQKVLGKPLYQLYQEGKL